MERLSDTAIEIINELHTERLDYSSEYIPLIDAANRLAAYEDTGVEPEDLNRAFNETAIIKLAAQALNTTPDHLRDIIKAEQDGRLVVLPCGVGDTVYWLHNGVITECRVHRVQMNRTGMFICLKSKVSHGAFRVDICLGKTVFLTREEAEAALKGGDSPENRAD